MTRRKKLTVAVIDRGQVLAEHACVATSDLTEVMISGSLKEVNEADVVVVKDEEKLVVLKSRIPFDELIQRIEG